jgi:hypothetical protein
LTLGIPVFWGIEGCGAVGIVTIGSKSVTSVVIRKRSLYIETMRIYE